MSDMINEVVDEVEDENLVEFDSSSLTFETGNAVVDTVLNVGLRVGMVTVGVIFGNLIIFGGKKGIEATKKGIQNYKEKKAEEKKAEETKAEDSEVVDKDGKPVK